jgi:two-component system sensor histidine kinase RegB
VAVGTQVVVIGAVKLALGLELALAPLGAIVALGALSNLALWAWVSRGDGADRAGVVGLVLAADVLMLTGLLHVSGGPLNPFTFLYLVHVVLGAVALEARGAGAIAALSIAAYGALFLIGGGAEAAHEAHMGHMGHGAHAGHGEGMETAMTLHLRGMWAAYTVTAVFVVAFVARMREALGRRERELERAREAQRRQERLASLATLAAGAAHELATPLSTIALVSKELERALSGHPEVDRELVEDAALLREQVDRCRAILSQMSTDAGQASGEAPEVVALSEVARALADGQAEVVVEEDARVAVPRRALEVALGGLTRNARQAARERGRPEALTLRVDADGRVARLRIEDRAGGVAPGVLARVGEPFFTTKEPGAGMGLGVFLARSLAERLGGALTLESEDGEGTTATLTLPREDA